MAQEEALENLGKLGPAARAALPALKKIAGDDKSSLRKKAVMTIFRIDPRADVSPAKRRFEAGVSRTVNRCSDDN